MRQHDAFLWAIALLLDAPAQIHRVARADYRLRRLARQLHSILWRKRAARSIVQEELEFSELSRFDRLRADPHRSESKVFSSQGRRAESFASQFSNSAAYRHSFAFPRHIAPELCVNFSPNEGVGNAGRPMHPQPRVRK